MTDDGGGIRGVLSGVAATPPLGWAPWIILALLGAAGGAVIAGGGAVGGSGGTGISAEAVVVQATSGYDCPGGVALTEFAADDRVLIVQRSANAGWLVVREPVDQSSAVWVPAATVEVVDGEPKVDTLPVGGCPKKQ